MSLYGGIKFSLDDPKGTGSKESDDNPATSAPKEPGPSATLPEPAIKAPKPPAKAPAQHSAALTFAPRIRQPKSSVQPATSYSAAPVFIDTLNPTIDHGPVSATASGSGTAATGRTSKGKEKEVVFGTDGKALAKAPAMTLHAGKRERGKEEEQRRKQKKKQRRRQQQQQLFSDFKPDEQYDPNRPNDLGEYQYYRKKLREEKRARLLEEKKRKDRDGSDGESSYYSDSEEDVPRRDAPKMWAPPPSIYGSTQSKAPPPPAVRASSPPAPPPPPRQPPASGDDAYARRAALSQVPSGDDAYARRQAMSRGETDQARPPPPFVRAPPPPQPRNEAMSGDEAFARRAALSQPQPAASNVPPPQASFRPPPMSGNMPPFPRSQEFVPPPLSMTQNMPPFPPSAPNQAGPSHISALAPPPTPSEHGIPGFGGRPTPAAVPSAPDAEDETPVEPAPPSSEDFAKMLEERRKAAASIAERLKNLGPAAPVHAPIPEPEDGSGTFAEKMMRKWGHKEGTGLGADGTGIKHALVAEHVAKPVDPKQPISKRQLAKQKAANANAKNRKWVVHNTTRGRIVNANDEERRVEEQGKYGEAGRVICLVGLVGSEDDIDEDLSEEIGEECSKYGIVERVVQHLVEPPPPDPAECLRVFIVFTGMAGAWRSVKELDGRFFGGRKIRATYFDEERFNAGLRDGPIL